MKEYIPNDLYVRSDNFSVGAGPVVTFHTEDGRVGVNTPTPNEELTIAGDISASGVFYGNGSGLTNLAAPDTAVRALTANWNSVYTNVQSNSAAWSLVTSYSTLIGNSTTNPITATHNLDTKDILFSVREVATDKIVYAAGRTIDNNNLELTFNTTPSINQYDLTVLCNGGIAGTSGGTTNNFALVKVTTTSYIQNATYTHNLYDDTTAGGQINVTLLPPAYHVAVTQHKKIGSTANVVLSAPNGTTIDGQTFYTLMNQYESIGIYSDGTNYFIE